MTDLGDLTPIERRYRLAVADMFEAMSEELRRECQLLAELAPEDDLGIRTEFDSDSDGFTVSWVGRRLGWISRHWLVTGEVMSE